MNSKKIKKYLITFFILFGTYVNGYSQKYEVGILAGGSYYYGDIVNEWEPSTIKGSFGVFVRDHITDKIKLKFFGGYCKIGGADSNSSSPWQRNRNLDFHSDVWEGSVQIEYCFVSDNNRGRRMKNRLIPYVFGGIGAFWFSPKTYDRTTGTEVSLAPLITNGGTKYSQYAVCVPFGFGIKYKITHAINFGFEGGMRYTSTSYLDDVDGNTKFLPANQYRNSNTIYWSDRSKEPRMDDGSTDISRPGRPRGKMGNINDMYFMYGLTVSYRIGAEPKGGGYRGNAIRCPRFY